eukprot:3445553-Amphidinium_carterae.1
MSHMRADVYATEFQFDTFFVVGAGQESAAQRDSSMAASSSERHAQQNTATTSWQPGADL